MTRMIAAILTVACLAFATTASAQKDDKALTAKAAKILKQLPDAERKAFIIRLSKMDDAARRAALKKLVKDKAALLKTAEAPPMLKQLEGIWKNLPPEQRRKMLGEAMKTLDKLPPKERKELLKQYKQFSEALGEGKKEAKKAKKAKKASKAQADTPPLRRVLEGLDALLEKHGESLDETMDQVEQIMGQARDYLELYRSMPKDQRAEVLKELEGGIKVFLEENVLPELEDRIKGLKEARETLSKTSGMMKEYLEAFQGLPEAERKQLIQDVFEAGKLFFEETIRPELEQEFGAVLKRVEKFRKLPRDEQRKKVRSAMRRLFGGKKK